MDSCGCNLSDGFPSIRNLDVKTLELAAIAASVAANCMPCLRHHLAAARKAKCGRLQIESAIQIATYIKQRPDAEMEELAAGLVRKLKR